ncbi:MAG: DeoR/GlpR transcriptional regulator, partial [Spirochaetales bacterium]|nr:DeoR/GlpR transcriptional regulator [Spirochaetales bacterium]
TEFLTNFYHLDYAVISCDGLIPDQGTTEQSLELAILKKQIISKTGKIILVADHSKIGVTGSCFCCQIDKIDTLVTDEIVSEENLEALRKNNINIIIAGSAK